VHLVKSTASRWWCRVAAIKPSMFRFSAFRIRTKLSLNIYTEAQALTDSDGCLAR